MRKAYRKLPFDDFKAKLPTGKITEDALADSDAAEAIIAHASYLATTVSKQLKAFGKDSAEFWHLDELRKQLRSFRWSFPLELRQVVADGFDRTKPMLSGPLFTSEKHPWPITKGGLQEPVAQFDLEEVGRLAGLELGKGLLQLWVGPEWDDHLIRVIPNDDLVSATVASIPKCITDEYFGGSTDSPSFTARAYGSWPSTSRNGVRQLWEIVGTMPKILSWPAHIKNESDDPELAEYLNSPEYRVIAQFLELLPDEPPSPSFHFFGNFYPIQYTVGDSYPTLLGLESEGPFLWGDHGNANISYRISGSGRVSFDFNWSCY